MPPGSTRTQSPHRGPQPVTWVAMLNRTLCLSLAVLVGGALLMSTTVMLDDPGVREHPAIWVVACAQALLITALIGYSRREITAVDAAVALLITSCGVVASASLTWTDWEPTSAESRQLLPAVAMGVQMLTAALVLRRRRWVLLTMVLTAVVSLWLSHGVERTAVEPESWVVPVSFSVSGVILIRALRNAASDAARLTSRRRAVRARVVAHSSAEVADDEGRRLIHDRVIGALAVVEAGQAPPAAAAACAGALRELELLDPATSASTLREVLMSWQHPRVRVGGDGWRLSPPPRVVTALSESAGEAIRNAGRHAGVEEVSVLLTTSPLGQASVEVHDNGSGFDPAHVPGFGLSESIVARMGQVGGEARIESAPGMGTAVRLLWPHRSSLRASPEAGVLAPGQRSRLYVSAMVPAVIAALFLAAYRAPETSHPAVSVALALIMAVGMVAVAWHIGRGRPTWPVVVGVAAFNAGVTVAAMSIASESYLVAMGAWVITAAGIVVGSASFEARVPQVLFLVVAQCGTTAGLAFVAPHVRPLEPAGALTVPLACATMSFAVGALLRRGSHLVAIQDAMENAELEEVGWVESAQAARQHYADQLQATIAPFLRHCVEDLPASSSALRQQATELIAQCRDLLATSDTTPASVRHAALTARRLGVRVAIRDAPSASPVAWALLAAVLEQATESDAVTLIPARSSSPARVTVIPRLSARAEGEVLEALEGHTLWMEHTDVTTSFILVSPEWGASAPLG